MELLTQEEIDILYNHCHLSTEKTESGKVHDQIIRSTGICFLASEDVQALKEHKIVIIQQRSFKTDQIKDLFYLSSESLNYITKNDRGNNSKSNYKISSERLTPIQLNNLLDQPFSKKITLLDESYIDDDVRYRRKQRDRLLLTLREVFLAKLGVLVANYPGIGELIVPYHKIQYPSKKFRRSKPFVSYINVKDCVPLNLYEDSNIYPYWNCETHEEILDKKREVQKYKFFFEKCYQYLDEEEQRIILKETEERVAQKKRNSDLIIALTEKYERETISDTTFRQEIAKILKELNKN